MKRAEYKIVSGAKGFEEMEKRVSEMLNQGWKPIGGIGFNAGYAYQAMARVTTQPEPQKTEEEKPKARGAQDAMRAIDQLT